MSPTLKDRKITVAQAASLLGLKSRGHASDVLRGRAEVVLSRFARLCAALGLDDHEIGKLLREVRAQDFDATEEQCSSRS